MLNDSLSVGHMIDECSRTSQTSDHALELRDAPLTAVPFARNSLSFLPPREVRRENGQRLRCSRTSSARSPTACSASASFSLETPKDAIQFWTS